MDADAYVEATKENKNEGGVYDVFHGIAPP